MRIRYIKYSTRHRGMWAWQLTAQAREYIDVIYMYIHSIDNIYIRVYVYTGHANIQVSVWNIKSDEKWKGNKKILFFIQANHMHQILNLIICKTPDILTQIIMLLFILYRGKILVIYWTCIHNEEKLFLPYFENKKKILK